MKKILLLSLSFVIFTGCSNQLSQKQIEDTLSKNPQIIAKLIEDNPELFVKSIQSAAKKAQNALAQNQQQDEQKEIEYYLKNPLNPKIRPDETFRGVKNGQIVIVEYSDFQCPFCNRGKQIVQELLKKYDGKISFVFKHLPLDFHPQAMITAQYYEAIRIQDDNKAIKFHDLVFENQDKLKNGEKLLEELAKKVGANLAKIKKDITSDAVNQRIKDDMTEASAFQMRGTPGFLINGVPLRGAYPVEAFDDIINKLNIK